MTIHEAAVEPHVTKPGRRSTMGFSLPKDLKPKSLIYSITRRRYPDHKVAFRIEDVPLPE